MVHHFFGTTSTVPHTDSEEAIPKHIARGDLACSNFHNRAHKAERISLMCMLRIPDSNFKKQHVLWNTHM